MRRSLPILLIIIVCISGPLWAEQVIWYRSNSIGQRLSILEDGTSDGYRLSVSQDEHDTTSTLYDAQQIVWVETVTDDGVHQYVRRVDGDGLTIFDAHYINDRLSSVKQYFDGIFEEETYIYDTDGKLNSIKRSRDLFEEQTLFFIDRQGRLEGLIVYNGLFPDWELDHTLLFTSDRSSFAIGEDALFNITVTEEDIQNNYTYKGGVLNLSEDITYDDGTKSVITSEISSGTMIETVYDTATDRILEERFTSVDPSEDYQLLNTYDDDGTLIERRITDKDGVSDYLYLEDEEGNRVVEIRRNGLMHKVIRYLTDTRVEKVYLEGEFYATITYSEDNEIIEVIHE